MGDWLTSDFFSIIAAAFVVGSIVGLTGMGGGALMTPALIFLGVGGASTVVTADLTAAAIYKTGGAITAPPNVRGIYPATTYGVYTYSPANLSRIVASTGSGLTRTYPANSITLLTLKPGRAPAVASAVHAKGKALGHRKVLIKIAVSAHVVPAGEVVVFKGRKKLKTATLVRGKVAIKLKKQKVGKVRYTIKYTGSAAVLPSSARLKVRMR